MVLKFHPVMPPFCCKVVTKFPPTILCICRRWAIRQPLLFFPQRLNTVGGVGSTAAACVIRNNARHVWSVGCRILVSTPSAIGQTLLSIAGVLNGCIGNNCGTRSTRTSRKPRSKQRVGQDRNIRQGHGDQGGR